MNITPDTNLLVRAIVFDNPVQGAAAQVMLTQATSVAITLSALCEFVWVLSKSYKFSSANIMHAIENLIAAENAVLNRPAVEFGLAMMGAGADFVDGVIAFEGNGLNGDVFVSFDRRAITAARSLGIKAQRP